jgi:glycosyltransferase involved in cell wall biosynthesis
VKRYWDIARELHAASVEALPSPPPRFWRRFLRRTMAQHFPLISDEQIHPDVAPALVRGSSRSVDPARPWPKTLHCIGSLGAGGAERQLVNLLCDLHERGHDAQSLLTINPLEGEGAHYLPLLRSHAIDIRSNNKPIREEGVELIRSRPDVVELIMKMPWSFCAWTLDLWVEISLQKPDVAHLWLDHTNIWGGPAALLADVPAVVLSTRNVHPANFPYLYSPYMHAWYQWLEKCPRVHFINNSHPGADSYAEWIGCSRDRFEVILNGVHLTQLRRATPERRAEIRAEIGVPQDARVVVGAFRMSDEKRPLLFVDAFADVALETPDLHAVLMGEGPLGQAVIERAAERGVAERFHAVGRRSDLPEVMSSMDVFLHTAWWEGTPNVVLEAQQLMLPVVVSNGGGSADAVAHGATGLLVQRDDEPAMAAALKQVLADLDTWRQKAAHGPSFIASRFGIARMVDETLAMQRRALAARRWTREGTETPVLAPVEA